jgi:hypothetical protein
MGTVPSVTDVTLMETPLNAASPKTIILKNTGESKREYDVDYSISALTANAYMNKIPVNYSTTVTYSFQNSNLFIEGKKHRLCWCFFGIKKI